MFPLVSLKRALYKLGACMDMQRFSGSKGCHSQGTGGGAPAYAAEPPRREGGARFPGQWLHATVGLGWLMPTYPSFRGVQFRSFPVLPEESKTVVLVQGSRLQLGTWGRTAQPPWPRRRAASRATRARRRAENLSVARCYTKLCQKRWSLFQDPLE